LGTVNKAFPAVDAQRRQTLAAKVNELLATPLATNRPEKSGRIASANLKYSHPVLHFGWHAIVPHHRAGITQPAGFALDHEAPQRIARRSDQFGPCSGGAGMVPIEFGKRLERRLERASLPAERGSLLLRQLIIERGDAASTDSLSA
jgi:hypothetical protein